jgi:uncharacterized membrane protein
MSVPTNTEVTSDDKLWALLAYILAPIVPIIILLMADKKDRPFLKAHNIQALILGIITVITSSFCVGILVWIYAIYCGIQAYNGKLVEIPVITNLCKGQGWA